MKKETNFEECYRYKGHVIYTDGAKFAIFDYYGVFIYFPTLASCKSYISRYF